MLGKLLGLSGIAGLHLLGWNTSPNLMCRNLSAMGNYCTCSNDGAFANVCLVKHGGIHSDECAFSDCGSVDDGTMSNYFIYFFNHKSKNLSYTT